MNDLPAGLQIWRAKKNPSEANKMENKKNAQAFQTGALAAPPREFYKPKSLDGKIQAMQATP